MSEPYADNDRNIVQTDYYREKLNNNNHIKQTTDENVINILYYSQSQNNYN